MKPQVDINRNGIRSAYLYGPLDETIKSLRNYNYRVISLEQMAKLIILRGEEAFISRNGNVTLEAFLSIPGKGVFLTKRSPILGNVSEAARCYENRANFKPTDEQVEECLADSVKVKETKIPVLRLAEEELTAYAFGRQANNYGKFLKNAQINYLNVYVSITAKTPFARQAQMGGLETISGLNNCPGSIQHGKFWVRGIQNGN